MLHLFQAIIFMDNFIITVILTTAPYRILRDKATIILELYLDFNYFDHHEIDLH